jgi:hypothetical protein
MKVWTGTFPIRMDSMLNLRLHWASKHKKVKALRDAAIVVPRGLPLPCRVIITRIAPRELDGDNLQGAAKGLRDGIADRLGVDDRDPRVSWLYAQERGKPREYAVRISITSAEALKAMGVSNE